MQVEREYLQHPYAIIIALSSQSTCCRMLLFEIMFFIKESFL